MHLEGSIRAVNLRLRDHFVRFKESNGMARSITLAKTRAIAKFEEPRGDTAARRRTDAWQRWITFDEGLQPEGLLGPHWAKARLLIHQYLSDFRMGELMFTNGSSFEPLGNKTSVACKLTGPWTLTPDCFDLFAKYSFWHRALKHAVKKRFISYCTTRGYDLKLVNRILWDRFKNSSEPAYQVYCFKLDCVVTYVNGNRWSTVPKNNLKDRAICLEPLCNMLVQRAVGLGIRQCLKDTIGIDLDTLADVHRRRISDNKVATIDLSDCSDAISVRLIKYLLPKRVLNKVLACRSDMTLGPDGNYYITNKVSSMGNGFTFDLMSLVLTALTRSFDISSTVFGDDIICQNQYADDVIDNLRRAGFVVNQSKTNIRSSYRESCGAHFIDGEGYVTSFDFKWVKSPEDLIVTCNKVAILSSIYGEPFESLRAEIWSCVPKPLLGATTSRLVVHTGRPPAYELDTYIRYGPVLQVHPKAGLLRSLRGHLKQLHKPGEISIAKAYVCTLSPATDHLRSANWDIYFQYIRNGRRSKRIPRLVHKSTIVARVGEEQIGLVKALLP